MKRFFLAILVFSTLFIIKSLHADSVSAAAGVITGTFSNARGAIAVNVSPAFKRANGTYACFVGQTVAAGQTLTVICADTLGTDNPPYSLSFWYNSCGDSANNVAITPASGGSYTFATQDVHCTNTNSSITITDTKCTDTTGTVTWRLNVNSDGSAPNIKTPFKVYKSLTSPVVDASPGTQAYVSGPPVTTSYGPFNITLPATGNYYVEVKSFANSPNDTVSYTAPGVMMCAGSMVPPSNFVAVTSCTGTTPVVAFTWTGAGPATTYTFAYLVETNLTTDPGPAGSWSGPSSTPSPPSNTYVDTLTLTAAQTYYAHVKAVATPVSTPANLFSASVSFTVPTCVVGPGTPAVFPANNDVITCASTTDNGDLVDGRIDGYENAVPDRAKFTWTRATPNASIAQEKLQYTTNSSFGTYTEIDHAAFTSVVTPNPDTLITIGSQRMHILTGLTLNATYYFRVKTLIAGLWVTSEIRSFRSPFSCFNPSLPTTGHGISPGIYAPNKNGFTRPGYGYCIGTVPYVRLGWVVNKQVLINYPNDGFVVTRWWSDPFYASSMNLSWSGPVTGVVVVDQWFAAGLGVDSNFGVAQDMIPNCTIPNAAPSNLTSQIQQGCFNDSNGLSPFIFLQFTDNATNETGFNVEISSDPFTGDSTTTRNPSQWGVKTFPLIGGTAGTLGWWWSGAVTGSPSIVPLTSGNANPQAPPGSELVPLEGVTYYWRVRANGTGANSAYKYDDGTLASSVYPSGRSFTMPYCSPRSDLSATIDGGSWKNSAGVQTQSFAANENVSVDIIIKNEPISGAVNNPATDLYFYFKGAGTGGEAMPDCSASPQVPKTTIPLDGAPSALPPLLQIYTIGANSLPPGTSTKKNVRFNTGTTQGGFTGYGYVVPSCVMAGAKDPNFANNKTGGFGYSVGVNKFFETKGGDVGAKGNIRIGVPNPASYNISDYLIAGNDSVSGTIANLKVNSTTGRRLSGYLKNQVLGGGGVYEYFRSRFRSKATTAFPTTPCSITLSTYNTATNNLYYCAGDVNVDAVVNITSGNPVFFIDGDLNINQNITVTSPATAVFIVKGGVKKGINVATSVTTLQGIFISRQGFVDGTSGGEIAAGAGAAGKLTITGGLYVDGEDGGKLQLDRHWGGTDFGLNAITPSETIIFDPGYLITLSSILASPAVGWKEVAP